MNIFVLDPDPIRAARMQCDKHVCKMVIESAQMLSFALPVDVSPYARSSHFNHPCSVWARRTLSNAEWLAKHALELSAEYMRRYGKVHACDAPLRAMAALLPSHVPAGPLEPFVLCMPDEYRAAAIALGLSAVDAYRMFYIGEKSRFARWRFPCSPAPAWFRVRGSR